MSFAVPERGAREYGGQVAHEDGAKAYARFLVRARRVTGQQARYGCRLLRRCEWDCCFVALPVLDRMQRRLWEVGQGEQSALVPEHEGLSARLAALVRVVDLAIGGLVAASGAVDVLVVSAHEVGPVRWQFRANQWLAESGLLAPARPPTSVFARVWRGLWAHPERSSFGSDIDWRGTSAYVESSDACGIRVNLRGREAGGAVAPGAPYEEVRARILEGLRGLRHPEANVPLFAAAFRREELGGGPGPSGAPDVICLVDDSTVALDPRLGGPRFARANHTGAPRPGGLLIAHGPRIEPGGRPSGARLVDFAPTLLRLFGLAAPDHMQGQVPEGLLIGEAGESAVPPPTRPGPAGTTSPYTDEEARQVEERLRGLGYL
jgi:predicted AlkP superfamily phosphohydrolase/phosphomutase